MPALMIPEVETGVGTANVNRLLPQFVPSGNFRHRQLEMAINVDYIVYWFPFNYNFYAPYTEMLLSDILFNVQCYYLIEERMFFANFVICFVVFYVELKTKTERIVFIFI